MKVLVLIELYVCLFCLCVWSFYKFVFGILFFLLLFKKRLGIYFIFLNVKEVILMKEILLVFLEGFCKENYFEYFFMFMFVEEL